MGKSLVNKKSAFSAINSRSLADLPLIFVCKSSDDVALIVYMIPH